MTSAPVVVVGVVVGVFVVIAILKTIRDIYVSWTRDN